MVTHGGLVSHKCDYKLEEQLDLFKFTQMCIMTYFDRNCIIVLYLEEGGGGGGGNTDRMSWLIYNWVFANPVKTSEHRK